jgi:hypothetical protein
MALTACPECKSEVSTMAATCPRCGAPQGRAAGGGVPSAGPAATPDAASTRLKVHTAVATALVLGSSVGLMAQTRTTAAGPGIAAALFGLLFVLAIFYYVEVRVRSSRHRK